MTLLAAFQTLLHRYAGVDDVVVGSPIAGRRRVETEGLIGFFVNTLVLRTDLSGDPAFRELLGRVRETVVGGHDHQDLPFEKLVEEVGPPRSASWAPLVQVRLQDPDQGLLELPGVTASRVAVDTGTVKFDLTASVREGRPSTCTWTTWVSPATPTSSSRNIRCRSNVMVTRCCVPP